MRTNNVSVRRRPDPGLPDDGVLGAPQVDLRLINRLPRLSALPMFEAAARHQSFTLAGQELRVTQAAVSQQIRALEKDLGVTLFTRFHRSIVLTQAGMRLQAAVAETFDRLAGIADNLRGSKRSAGLMIGATFAVATFTLIPRLHEFRALYPDLAVHIVATDRGFDKIADQIDAAIAFGAGKWPGFQATLLRSAEVFPVCSPKYAGSRRSWKRVDRLLEETLLSVDNGRTYILDWPEWFAHQGMGGYSNDHNLKLNNHSLLLQAACEGQGIALGWNILTDDLLARGTLVRPVAETMHTTNSFYFLVSEKRRNEQVLAFQSWVMQTFARPTRPTTITRRRRLL
jgi:DNA-binding transcriptional LysR family regulator